jgi:hypothetical protein
MTIVVKDLMAMAFVTMTKKIGSGFCDKSECNIVMAIINVFHDNKCNHISHILA